MKTKLMHTATLGTLLTLAVALPALAMDHSAMGHGSTGALPAVVAANPPAEQPAGKSPEIRKAVVKGYTLTYTLIDMKQLMAASSAPMAHDMSKMKSHHLMVNPVGPDGTAVASGKAGFLVVQPDKTEVKAMAMLMEGGFGADLDLLAKGDYKITCKITFGDTTLVDEFLYPVK
jgi:hypothetical protein